MYHGSRATFCKWYVVPFTLATNGFDAGKLFFGFVFVGSNRK